MSTNEERREAAKQKLADRLEADRKATRKRKAIIAGVSLAAVLAVAATASYFIVDKVRTDRFNEAHDICEYVDQEDNLQTMPEEPPEQVPPEQHEEYRDYARRINEMVAEAEPKKRTAPKPSDVQRNNGTVDVLFDTNEGPIPATLTRDSAPCNTGAIVSLIENKYYDDTPCSSLMTTGDFAVLQCGDPTGTGASNPGWGSPDEPPTDLELVGQPDPMSGQPGAALYPRGTIAVLSQSQGGQNPNTGSATFLIAINDSQLPPEFAVIGNVDPQGFDVLDPVLAAGATPEEGGQEGTGKPNMPITITEATVVGTSED